MNRIRLVLNIGMALFVLGAGSLMAQAQATRTWVSGVGDDANPCSRTAPCKTFAGAISKTAPGGEIDVLDPGGFGAVTITKSISIEACCIAGVLVSGTNAIVVAAGPSDFVVLRGLTIEGLGTGLDAIKFNTGGSLYVENCFINRFSNNGINFSPAQAGNTKLFVKDTVVRNCNTPVTGGGILVGQTGGGTASALLDNVRLENNIFGLRGNDNSRITIRNSESSGNTNNGILAFSNGGPVEINIESCVASNNGTNGVASQNNAAAVVRISNVTITNNAGTGVAPSGGGIISSAGNNRNGGNGAPGGPNGPAFTVQ